MAALARVTKLQFWNKTQPAIAQALTVNHKPDFRTYATSNEAPFELKPFKLHKLDDGPNLEVSCTRDEAIKYYRTMQVIRRMETTASNLYKEKKIRGFCHLYSGQEACAVGMKAAMKEDDATLNSYRCHGWVYVMGATVKEVLSELTFQITGNVYGKGGSMHMYFKNFYGGNGIVGSQCPIGTGIAWAMKYQKKDAVCLTCYGDGAANQGQLYEAFNIAKLWNLPCIFVCENNGYGMGTSAARSSASHDYYTRGDYVPGVWIDAMDILAVREGTRFGREHCLSGKGPIVLEMATYRYGGHSMSDPGTSYRTRAEIDQVRKTRDPITGFKDRILAANLVTEEELKDIDKSVRVEVDEANTAAHAGKFAPVDMLYTDLYATTPYTVRGTTVDHMITPKISNTRDLVAQQA